MSRSPATVAVPFAGPKNSTITIPTRDSRPHRIAVQSGRSLNSSAPAGTRSSGDSDEMNSEWATLVFVTAVKRSVMLAPKKIAGTSTRFHVTAVGNGAPVRARQATRTTHHNTAAPIIRQNAMTEPGVWAHLTSA